MRCNTYNDEVISEASISCYSFITIVSIFMIFRGFIIALFMLMYFQIAKTCISYENLYYILISLLSLKDFLVPSDFFLKNHRKYLYKI